MKGANKAGLETILKVLDQILTLRNWLKLHHYPVLLLQKPLSFQGRWIYSNLYQISLNAWILTILTPSKTSSKLMHLYWKVMWMSNLSFRSLLISPSKSIPWNSWLAVDPWLIIENGPKTIKTFVNRNTTLSFEDTESEPSVDNITLTSENLKAETAPTNLRYVKYQSVHHLTVFKWLIV